MLNDTNKTPGDVTDDSKLAENITDKKGYGQHWHFSVRHVDNLIAEGLPHLKIGARRVRILVPEADAWMHKQFFTQRRGQNGTTKTKAADR